MGELSVYVLEHSKMTLPLTNIPPSLQNPDDFLRTSTDFDTLWLKAHLLNTHTLFVSSVERTHIVVHGSSVEHTQFVEL